MIYFIILALLTILPQTASAEIIRVPDDHETISDGILAANNGDTVLVAPDAYLETINFRGRRIVVASHFLTTGEEEFIAETIIDAEGEDRVVKFNSGENDDAQLIGFTILGGESLYGAGIYCSGSSPTLSHLVVTENNAGNHGGGIYCTNGASPLITDSKILNNSCLQYGGGISIRESSPTIIRTIFAGNTADLYGGAAYCTRTEEGDDCLPVFDRVTAYGNSAEEGRGGIHAYNDAQPTIVNIIHWANEPPDLRDELDITYSDIQGDYNGQGNIDQDPEFTDPDEGDFNLNEDSPCIDAGDPNSPEDPDGTRADMGAKFFYQVSGIEVVPEQLDFDNVNVGLSRVLVVTIISHGPAALEIDGIYIDPDIQVFSIIAGGDPHRLEEGEEQEVSIQFAPDSQDVFQSSLVIDSDDPDNAQVEVRLIGSGLPPAPDIDVQPEALNFGEVAIFRTEPLLLTINNSGLAALAIDDIRVEGEDADAFTVDFQEAFEIEGEGSAEIEVVFEPLELSEFDAEVVIESNDPDDGIVRVALTGSGTLPERHFEPIGNTGVNHSILVMDATLLGEPLVAGSEIAVLSQDDLCCGAAVWLGEEVGFPAWGDNVITVEIDGLVENEQMAFIIWDARSGEEFLGVPDFERGNDIYRNNGVSVLELDGQEGGNNNRSFWVALQPGWSMVSAPIIPVTDDIIELWAPVAESGNLLIMKDHLGRFFLPDIEWTNIPRWEPLFGYQVKMDARDSLLFVGEGIAADTPIELDDSWSIVAYLPDDETDPITAFASIADVLNIAKDAFGNFYLPEIDFTNMEDLRQGRAYQVDLAEEAVLVWNTEEELNSLQPSRPSQPVYFPAVTPTGSNMSLLIKKAHGMVQGMELGVFSPEGRSAGSVRLDGAAPWGTAVWGDDPATVEVDGVPEGQAIFFRLWTGEREIEIEPKWISGEPVYHTDGLGIIALSRDLIPPAGFELEKPYPNPFNGHLSVRIGLASGGQATIIIHDLNGRDVAHVFSGHLAAGWHTLNWNAACIPSGVYLLQAASAEETRTAKIMLLR